MKFKRLILVAFIQISSAFSLAIDLPCDPFVDCERKICAFGGCVSTDDPICTSVRAVCRSKCGGLNDDANGHIREQNNNITTQDQRIKDAQTTIGEVNSTIGNLQSTMNKIDQQDIRIQQLRAQMYTDQSLSSNVVSGLESLIASAIGSTEVNGGLVGTLPLSQEARDLISFIVEGNKSQVVSLKQIVAQIKSNSSSELSAFLIEHQRFLEETKAANLAQLNSNNINLQNQVKIINEANVSIDRSRAEINTQEHRKCPSNLF